MMERNSTEQPIIIESLKWLDRLNEKSWEAELLISGGALFSLLQLTAASQELGKYLPHLIAVEGIVMVNMLPAIIIRALTIGFLLHLLMRAIWLSLLALHRVYPNGIKIEMLKIDGPYLEEAIQQNSAEKLLRMDRLCSLIFHWSFTITFIFGGIGTSTVLMFFVTLLNFSWLTYLLISTWLIFVYIDLFSAGWLRKGVTGKIYRPIYLFWNLISLGFLWRPSIQTIFTNSKNRALTFLFVLLAYLLLMIASILSVSRFGSQGIIDGREFEVAKYGTSYQYYRDENSSDEWIDEMSIQSMHVNDNILKVFIPYKNAYDEFIKKNSENYFSEIILLQIDGQNFIGEWIGYKTPSNQLGAYTILSIEKIPKGKHLLKASIGGYEYEIPFWKD